MATNEYRDDRYGSENHQVPDADELVDCEPVECLTDDQKEAAREGLETFLTEYHKRHPTAAVPDNATTSAVVASLVDALADPSIGAGDRCVDRETEKELVVTERFDVSASEFGVLATRKTVAEHNPEYPADDRVIEAVYVDSISSSFGSSDQNPAQALADLARKGELDERDVRTYAFPESRLVPTDDSDPHTGGPL